jgi:hypothetical protein
VEAVRASDAALQQSLEARVATSCAVVATRFPAAEPSAADDPSSSSEDDSPAAPVKRPPRPVSFLTSAGRVALTPRRLPRLDNVPKYMTWTMTTENTLIQARAAARGGEGPGAHVKRCAGESPAQAALCRQRGRDDTRNRRQRRRRAGAHERVRTRAGVPAHAQRTQVDDSAEQRAWSRQEDFLILGVASQLRSNQARPTQCGSPRDSCADVRPLTRRLSTSWRRYCAWTPPA